nr:MAG TPA: hypothetical protein [Caudoviricetes sp.]
MCNEYEFILTEISYINDYETLQNPYYTSYLLNYGCFN